MIRRFTNSKLKTKILLILVLPFSALLYSASIQIVDKIEVSRDAKRVENLSALAVRVSAVAHELQRERGMTSIYVTSKGTKYGDNLRSQRNESDRRITALREAVANSDASPYAGGFRAGLGSGIQKLQEIPAHRLAANNLTVSPPQNLAFYSDIIATWLNLVERAGVETSSPELARHMAAYSSLLWAKENCGIERATLSSVFTSDRFEPFMLQNFIAVTGAQKTYTHAFLNYATPHQSEFYRVKMQGPSVKEVQRLEELALARIATGQFEVAPDYWFKNSTDKIDLLKEVEDKISSDLLQTSVTLSRRAYVSLAWTSVILLGVCVGILIAAASMVRAITEPLYQLIQVARNIGQTGDLDQQIDIDRNDEIGELGGTFRNMVLYLKEMARVSESISRGDLAIEMKPLSAQDTLGNAFLQMKNGLSGMVLSVRDSSAQVAAGSEQVADASHGSAEASVHAASAIDEVTLTIREINLNAQNIVKNAQVQAVSVSQTSVSIHQMVTSIQRVADTAKTLLDIAAQSHKQVESGIGMMQKANHGLLRINTSIVSSAEIIAALERRAESIGKIIDVIDEIADQTNLLALNAAIEAARAGEHGRGFAVVADEVRKLAEKSAESAKEISEIICGIQQGARTAVDDMDRSTAIVDEGLKLGNDLSTALTQISVVVAQVHTFAQEIGAATAEQSQGSTQISQATQQLRNIADEISSAVEEQSAGTDAVAKAMERMYEMVRVQTSSSTELAASSQQMSTMAGKLLQSVERFSFDTDHTDQRRPVSRQTGTERAREDRGNAIGSRRAISARH